MLSTKTAWLQRFRQFLLLGSVLLLTSCQPPPELPQGLSVKVERVVSGQTLEIVDPSSPVPILQQVRLIGIEAPDLNQQPWGEEAKNRLEQLANGQQVLLEADVTPKDRFNRRLAYVWREDILLNEQLVKEGYVLASLPTSYQRDRSGSNAKYSQRLAYAQEWARLMGRGLWNPARPLRQTPAEFRLSNRK